MISVEELTYPIIVEIPDDYWTFSNYFDEEVKYIEKNKDV